MAIPFREWFVNTTNQFGVYFKLVFAIIIFNVVFITSTYTSNKTWKIFRFTSISRFNSIKKVECIIVIRPFILFLSFGVSSFFISIIIFSSFPSIFGSNNRLNKVFRNISFVVAIIVSYIISSIIWVYLGNYTREKANPSTKPRFYILINFI